MTDSNKFAKLHEIGYTVQVTCGLCIHGDFGESGNWGGCTLHKDDCIRRVCPVLGLTVLRMGNCSNGVFDQILVEKLGSYQELVKCRK